MYISCWFFPRQMQNSITIMLFPTNVHNHNSMKLWYTNQRRLAMISSFQRWQSLEYPTSTSVGDRYMHHWVYCTKQNSERLLFKAYFHIVRILSSLSMAASSYRFPLLTWQRCIRWCFQVKHCYKRHKNTCKMNPSLKNGKKNQELDYQSEIFSIRE